MKPQSTTPVLRRSAPRDADTPPTPEDAAALLAVIPSRPDYAEWIRVIGAVVACRFSLEDTHCLLTAWSPDEKLGESVAKFRSLQSGTRARGIGALVNIAKQHGLDASAFARARWRRNHQGATLCRPAAIRFNASVSSPATPPFAESQTPASTGGAAPRTPPAGRGGRGESICEAGGQPAAATPVSSSAAPARLPASPIPFDKLPPPPPPRDIKFLDRLRTPTDEDLFFIADSRDLPWPFSLPVLRRVADMGLLHVARLPEHTRPIFPKKKAESGDWIQGGAPAWTLTDAAQQVVMARRMDRRGWNLLCKTADPADAPKNWNLGGSRGHWVIGLAEAAADPDATLALCEGPPDALSLFVLRELWPEFADIAPAAFTSCSVSIPPEQLPFFTGRRVILFAQHDTRHTAGQDAAKKWTAQLRKAEAADIRLFDLADWHVAGTDYPEKDINDFLKHLLAGDLILAPGIADAPAIAIGNAGGVGLDNGTKPTAGQAGQTLPPATTPPRFPADIAPARCPVCLRANIIAVIGGMTCASVHATPLRRRFPRPTATAIL